MLIWTKEHKDKKEKKKKRYLIADSNLGLLIASSVFLNILLQDKQWIVIFHLTKVVISQSCGSKAAGISIMLPGALHLHCSLLLRSLLFHRVSIPKNHCQTQNGTIAEPFPHTATKPGDPFFKQSTKTTNQQIFLFKGTHLAWTALPGISSRFSGFFAPVVLNLQLLDYHWN